MVDRFSHRRMITSKRCLARETAQAKPVGNVMLAPSRWAGVVVENVHRDQPA